MKRRSVLAAICCVVFLWLAGCARPEAEPFFFIQMTDVHIGKSAAKKGITKETRQFERAIAHANRLDPAFVVVTGDLIHDPGDEKQIAELKRIADQLDTDIPLHWVVGNHDIGLKPTITSLAKYRQTLGKDWYSFRVEGTCFVAINSMIIQEPAQVEDEMKRQEAWLGETLKREARRSPDHIVLFSHYPLFMESPEKDRRFFRPADGVRQVYLDMFQQYGVDAVYSGHAHRNVVGLYGTLEAVVTGAIFGPGGFRIVKVYPDRLEHEFFLFNAVPESVELDETQYVALAR